MREGEGVLGRVAKEFAAGQNLYVFALVELARSILALAGEKARRDFLIYVGQQLDAYSDTKHRLAWKGFTGAGLKALRSRELTVQ